MDSVEAIVVLARQALLLSLILSLPVVITAGIVGLLVGLIQAVTQLQDQALLMALKLSAVIAILFVTGGWMSGELISIFEKSIRAAFL
jgi:type III secretion protein S